MRAVIVRRIVFTHLRKDEHFEVGTALKQILQPGGSVTGEKEQLQMGQVGECVETALSKSLLHDARGGRKRRNFVKGLTTAANKPRHT